MSTESQIPLIAIEPQPLPDSKGAQPRTLYFPIAWNCLGYWSMGNIGGGYTRLEAAEAHLATLSHMWSSPHILVVRMLGGTPEEKA